MLANRIMSNTSFTPITFVAVGAIAGDANAVFVNAGAPAGIQNDDILIAHAVGVTGNFTWPAGFTDIFQTQGSGYVFGASWKRASGEAGAYMVTSSTTGVSAIISAWRGCKALGSPINDFSSKITTVNPATVQADSITTTGSHTMILFLASQPDASGGVPWFSGWSGTNPTFSSEAYDTEAAPLWPLACAYGIMYTAGATGARTTTTAENTQASHGALVALKSI